LGGLPIVEIFDRLITHWHRLYRRFAVPALSL
jgi:hypothetical protein